MTVKEFIEFVKEYDIPEDYEIIMGYESDGDYSYGHWTTPTEDYIGEIDHKEKTVELPTYLWTH